MGSESPDVVLIDINGNFLSVQNGVMTPVSTPALMVAGSDGINSRYLLVDSSGRLFTNTDGYVTNSAPTYLSNTFQPLSLTSVGALRVDSSGSIQTPIQDVFTSGTISTADTNAGIGFGVLASFTPVVNSFVSLTLNGQTTATITCGTGVFTANGLTIEASPDGTHWTSVYGTTDGGVIGVSAFLAELTYLRVNIAGFKGLRVRAVSGTTFSTNPIISIEASVGNAPIKIDSWFGSVVPTVGSKISADSIPVVIASDQAAIPTQNQSSISTGALDALNATVTLTLNGASSVGMQLQAGTLIGTIVAEGSNDNITWYPALFDDSDGGNKTFAFTFSSANTVQTSSIIGFSGMLYVRIRVSAYVSGTANVTISGSSLIRANVFDGASGGLLAPATAQVGGSDGTNLRVFATDTSGRQIIIGAAADGTSPSGNPILIAGQDGTNTQSILTDTSGRQEIIGSSSIGSAAIGNPVFIGGQNSSGNIEPIGATVDRAAMTAGIQVGIPIIGQSSGVGRIATFSRLGHIIPGNQTLLALDVVEGTVINSWLWTQSTTTMTIAQTTGVLTLNNGAITTNATDAIITTNKQFPIINQVNTACSFRALISQTTNAVNELGFGTPTGITTIVNNGAFFRINTSGTIHGVISFNGTETVTATLATLVATSYYLFIVSIGDNGVRFIVEDANGVPLVDTTQTLSLTASGIGSVSHLPAFARVYTSGIAGSAPQTKISSFQVWQYGIDTSKPWNDQISGAGRSSNINPITFSQALQSSPGTAPTTITPTNTTVGYTTLGGEMLVNMTATSINWLGVFGYTVPSPYTLNITGIVMNAPIITTAFGATATVLSWELMVASSTNQSTATGYRYPLGTFSTTASAIVGTVLSGSPINIDLRSPIIVLPGQVVLILVKVVNGAATGTYYGSVLITGYYE